MTGRAVARQYALVLGIALLLGLLPLAVNARFYFRDDMQAAFLPLFFEIGRQLAEGQFPLLTLNSWWGSAIAAEYQYGVFNPVSLAVSLLLHLCFENLARAAAFVAILYLMILAGGIFAAARALRCNAHEAMFAAVGGVSGVWIVYLAAASWISILTSVAWLAWAIAGAESKAATDRGGWRFGAAVYLTLTAGWPQTVLVLAAVLLALALRQALRGGIGDALRFCLPPAFALALALPCLLSLALHVPETIRPAAWPDAMTWATPPVAFLGLGFPSFASVWTVNEGVDSLLPLPLTFVHWAVPIVLLSVCLRRPSLLLDREARFWLVAALALALAAALPTLPFLRWPHRFLPHFEIALLLATARLLAAGREAGAESACWSLRSMVIAVMAPLAILLPLALAAERATGEPLARPLVSAHLGSAAMLFAGALLVRLLLRKGGRSWLAAVGVVQVFCFAFVLLRFPENPLLHDRQIPAERYWKAEDVFGDGYSLFLYQAPIIAKRERARWRFFALTPLYRGARAINGYTPMPSRGPFHFLDFGFFSELDPERPFRFFEVEPRTGRRYAELLRIDTVIAKAGAAAKIASANVPAGWVRKPIDGEAEIYRRLEPLPALPGTLSYLPPGVAIEASEPGIWRERLRLRVSDAYDGSPLVFARAWYPDYRAEIGGEAAVLDNLAGIVPALALPKGFHGEVTLTYLPRGLVVGFYLAAAGLLLLMPLALWLGRRDRAPVTNGRASRYLS